MPKTETGQVLNNMLPMSPTEGPPLPRVLGIKWPSFKAWREKGEKEIKRVSREVTKDIHPPF